MNKCAISSLPSSLPAAKVGLLSSTQNNGETLTENTKALLAKWPEIDDAFRAVTQRLTAKDDVENARSAAGAGVVPGELLPV